MLDLSLYSQHSTARTTSPFVLRIGLALYSPAGRLSTQQTRPLPLLSRADERACGMKRLWTNDDLVAQWTLQPNELALVEYKEGANRLGFALLLKYFQIDGRFPRQKHDVPISG
jgi:hypothetical protein